MHELGLVQAIVAATVRRAAGRQVSAVRVRVSGHPVDSQVIDFGFRVAAAGTVAETARLEVVTEPPTVRCRDCGDRAHASSALALVACQACGGIDVEVAEDGGVVVESIWFTGTAARESV